MMQKRTVYSLLLISFILVFALSLSAQEVTFETKNVTRCEATALDITVDNPVDLAAIEIVLEVTTTSGTGGLEGLGVDWDAGFTNLTNRIVDLSAADGISPDTVRIAAMMLDAGDACLPTGQLVVGQLTFTTSNSCSAVVELAGGTFECPTFSVSTQFVDCDLNLVPAAVNAGTVTFVNQQPTIDAIADVTIEWGDTYTGTAVGDDPDLGSGTCEALTYSIVSGPADLTINANTGAMTWATTGDDICSHEVTVQVEDGCGDNAQTTFNICVHNEAPVMTCPAPEETVFALGSLVELNLTAIDPDNGPASALTYTLAEFTGPGSFNLSATGEFTWQTLLDDAYKGVFDISVVVSDGGAACEPCSPRSADTCTFTISVVNYLITIENVDPAIQGQDHSVSIFMQNSSFTNYPMGGFDFLIQYDNSALTFNYAEPGQFLDDCGWEYFTYRYGPNGNCGSGCPTGEVRVVAIAETNDSPDNHPDCFTNTPGISNQLVELHFYVTNDRTFECMFAPIQFVWYDCGDNAISDVEGNVLFISNNVYSYGDTTTIYGQNIAADNPFPTITGANSTCDEGFKLETERYVDFVNGGIRIVCANEIDDRGDVNLNGVAYEIADAVLYSNYFVYGLGVFDPATMDAQIAASDINADGLTLSVADLVYLIRIVIGDADAYPKEVVSVNADYVHNNGMIKVNGELEVGAAAVVVEGNVIPELKAENMEMIYNFDGVNTRILVYSLEGNSFSGEMLNVDANIVSIDMADADGNPIAAKWLPSNFGLNQNYPNPFNPSTTVSFTLPVTSEYELAIFNVNGQKVTTFTGHHEAGMVEIEWNASDMASGVYFYRLTAGSFTDTKKMVLLK